MVKVFLQIDDEKEIRANTYVMGKIGGSCVVIDPGSKNEDILSYVRKHYEKCAAILLTHGHFDHIRGVDTFLKAFPGTAIPVYLHPEDRALVSDPDLNASAIAGEKVRGAFETIDIQDGETLDLKDCHIQVLHTPFHTKGSVCYLSLDDNALFTGDTLFKDSVGRTDLPNACPEDLLPSLRKILALKDTLVIYPGHGPLSNLGAEKSTNPYLLQAQK